MACSFCQDLCIEYQISTPSDLRQAIAVVRDNLADGTLKEISPEQSGLPQRSFSEVASSGQWDDVLVYRFQCQHCSEQFILDAETFHGSGGAWRPARGNEQVAL